MKENKTSIRERLLAVFGLAVIAAAILAAVVGGLYWATGKVSPVGLRWWTVIMTLVLPVAVFLTWKLGHTAAEAHLDGFDRGLVGAEQTLTTVGRGLSATASLARTAAQQEKKPQWQVAENDDLLPPARMLPVRAGGDVQEL